MKLTITKTQAEVLQRAIGELLVSIAECNNDKIPTKNDWDYKDYKCAERLEVKLRNFIYYEQKKHNKHLRKFWENTNE